jgi:hypothetical protein
MGKKDISAINEFQEVLLYTTPSGKFRVEMFLYNETIWLTQQKIADLFGFQLPAITKHLKNIFKSRELQEDSVCSVWNMLPQMVKLIPHNFTITGQSAVEIIAVRANSTKENMGLTHWNNNPYGNIQKSDVAMLKTI